MKKIHYIHFIAGAMLLGAFAADPQTHANDPSAESPLAVAVEPVRSEMIRFWETVPGAVRSAGTAQVAARVQGEVLELSAVPGDAVASGDRLARLSSEEWDARLLRAEAERELARLELERVRRLRESRAATQQELDAARARHGAAEAAYEEAVTLLGYTVLRAPFDGLVTARMVEVGDLASPGRTLFEMADPARYRAEVAVPESLARRLEVGDVLECVVDGIRPRVDAPIVEIAPASDPATRTVAVKLDLSGVPGLQNGQFVRARVPGAERTRLVIPADAMARRGQMEYVYVVEANRARMRIIRSVPAEGGKLEVHSGLETDELVVVSALDRLRDGMPVEVER